MDLSTSSFGGAASIESSVKNEEESANGNLAIIDNGQTAKLFNHQLKTTERTAVVDAATVD